MKKLSFLLIIPLLIASCISVQNADEEEENFIRPEDGMLIHITKGHEDAHSVLMAFKMATLMADSKDVILYLDIQAGALGVTGAEVVEMRGCDPLSTYIETLLDKGVEIYACPTCLSVMGYGPDDLMDGIKPADKDAFFDFTDGRIVTIDY